MQSVALILVFLACIVLGAISADVQCKVVAPSSNAVVVACSVGRLAAQP
jgi:hypothetical protein